MVEPLLQFFGHFWWLIFPLMGVMGMTYRAWERGARRRHERRLEIIRAKSELKVAQAAARGRSRAPLPQAADAATGPVRPVVSGRAPAENSASRLQRLFDAQDAVTARWLEYELDVAKLIAYPAMSDGRQPLTAAFLRAKKHADALRPASVKAKLNRQQLAEYMDAVTDYEVAFDVAERDARRLRDSSFTEDERKRLDTAKKLLTVAIDQAATPAERQIAYRRVREELDGLILISDEAIEVLEGRVALELTDTATIPKVADAAAPSVAPLASTAPAGPVPAPTVPPAPSAIPAAPPASGPWPVPSRGTTAPGRIVQRGPRR